MIELTLGMWGVTLITLFVCAFAAMYVIEKVIDIDLTPQHPQAKQNKAKFVLLTGLVSSIVFFGYWFANLVIFGNIKIKI